jgi:hypothetical protein
MGFVEMDPESGEYVLHPDPNMDWTPGPDGSTDTSGWLPHSPEPEPGLPDLTGLTGIIPDGAMNPDEWNPEPAPDYID